MYHYQENIQDGNGKVLNGWSMGLYAVGGDPATAPAVTIYSDRAGTSPIPGGTVQSVSKGYVNFYVPSGSYGRRYYDASGALQWYYLDTDMCGQDITITTAASAAAAAVSATTATTQATTATTQAGAVAAAMNSSNAPYANAAATYLPQGVAAFSVTARGTGGTNGTNILATYTGGTLSQNPVIRFDIVAGAIANERLVSPGLYIGTGTPTMPAITFPGAAGSPAATLTAGVIINPGQTYWVASADSSQILLYGNNAGSVATAPFGGTQLVLYGKATIDAFVASGLQTDITTAGGPYYERDSAGLVPLQITPDGGVFNVKRYRPGPVTGYNDKIDMHAELDNLATAIKLSTTTVALRNAVRNYGFYPQPAARLAVGDTPSIGALSTTSGISGTLVSPIDARIAWASGCPALYSDLSGNNSFPDNTLYSSRGSYYGRDSGNTKDVRATYYNAIEFNHTGTTLEIYMKAVAVPSGVANIRVLVNDCEAGTAILATNGSLYYMPITFSGSGTRRIRIEASGSAFGGVKVASSGEITTTGRSYPLVTIMGDSFVESASGAAGLGNVGAGEAIVLGRGLGFGITVAGVGQTGLINPGGTNVLGGAKVAFTDTKRLKDLTMSGITNAQTGLSASPSMGIVCGSVNDAGYSYSPYSSMEEAITAASLTIIDAWVAANSGKPLILMGPLYYSGPPNNRPPLDIYRIRDGMARAATMMAAQNVWFVDRLMPHKREGIYSTATDQASLYTLSADGVHPTFAGHAFDGLDDAHRLIKPIVMGMLA